MARPIKEETAYKVTLHKNGAYRYASTRPRVINEAGGKFRGFGPLVTAKS